MDKVLGRWAGMCVESSRIDPALYTKFDVKRGLRDISGKGVLAGLTQIGEVCATRVVNGETVPADGKLIYRGIDIEHLVEGFTAERRRGFEETAYLLFFGQLPAPAELARFEACLSENRQLPPNFLRDAILKIPCRDLMNAISRSVLSLYAYDDRADDIGVANILRQSLLLVAVLPLLSVYAYQTYLHYFENGSLVIHAPRPELGTAENFLHMLRADSRYTPLEAKLLDLALVLHAEHGGGNNSTFTTHVVSSSGTDTYSAISASLGSLKGPRHGGANIKALMMFEDLKRSVRDWRDEQEISAYLMRLLNKDAFDRAGLIYGVGHAVYSLSDPRTLILKRHAAELAAAKGAGEEYALYERVETLAPKVIAAHRKMYKGVSANVDFYSGFIYRLLDIPPALFTPLFAIARVVGWCAHRIEEIANTGKIVRPAYKSVAPRREYTSLPGR
ncbi:MAG: citrate synthase [Kiritimatiellae bacterium]|nr:citrate synthase [Kiritimatiellia bacterium]